MPEVVEDTASLRDYPSLRAAIRPICFSNQQVTNVPESKALCLRGKRFRTTANRAACARNCNFPGLASTARTRLSTPSRKALRASGRELQKTALARSSQPEALFRRDLILHCAAAVVSKAERCAVSSSGRNSAALIPSVPPEKPSI